MLVGGMVGHAMARNRYESMAIEQEQQQQLQHAQAQAAQATQAAHAAELQAAQAQSQAQRSGEKENDVFQRLEKLGNLKKQGLITDEEFQSLKSKLISSI